MFENVSFEKKAWVVSVNMGYGHQRTAFALRFLAIGGKNLNANDYDGIPKNDRKIWETTRKGYEMVSSFKRFPLIGDPVFSIMDYFQRILKFYPKRNLSAPTFQLKQSMSLIRKGWGKHFIEMLKASVDASEHNVYPPIISTFFTPAFMAEFFGYPGEIYCVVCDADISRAWAPLDPKTSRIKYFAPTERVVERLELYGVKKENIFFTGFPLPMENIGGDQSEVLKEDLRERMANLDSKGKYFEKYKILVEEKLDSLPENSGRPLTIMFAVGGAGAQREIGAKILKGMAEEIKSGKIKVILVAGIKPKVKEYFERNRKIFGLEGSGGLEIIFSETIDEYFKKFNSALRKTDVLWTKPSELSFYSALGLPIIVAPTIGSQEEFNKRWLLKSGFGISQENPNYAKEWIMDWINNGYLAEAAMQGFVEGERLGALNIEKIICG